MSKISLSSNILGTGTLTIASPNTDTDRTLTLPDAAGNFVLDSNTQTLTNKTINASQLVDASVTQNKLGTGVAGTGPAFSAYQSVAQTTSAGTSQKITFTTVNFDTNSNFASSRFTPTVAGYYQFNCGVRTDATISSMHAVLSKNTVAAFAAGSFTNTSLFAFMSSCSGLVFLNGTTDFVEVYVFTGTAVTLATGTAQTYFQGFLVRAA